MPDVSGSVNEHRDCKKNDLMLYSHLAMLHTWLELDLDTRGDGR